MNENLLKIQRWAMHGTVRQAYADMAARLTNTSEYDAELSGDTITFYRNAKEGGILGLFAKTVREPVLVITRNDGEVDISEQPRDPEFVDALASLLEAH